MHWSYNKINWKVCGPIVDTSNSTKHLLDHNIVISSSSVNFRKHKCFYFMFLSQNWDVEVI